MVSALKIQRSGHLGPYFGPWTLGCGPRRLEWRLLVDYTLCLSGCFWWAPCSRMSELWDPSVLGCKSGQGTGKGEWMRRTNKREVLQNASAIAKPFISYFPLLSLSLNTSCFPQSFPPLYIMNRKTQRCLLSMFFIDFVKSPPTHTASLPNFFKDLPQMYLIHSILYDKYKYMCLLSFLSLCKILQTHNFS